MPHDHERQYERAEMRHEMHEGDFHGNRNETVSPVFHPQRPHTKIIISPGAGKGWITYAPPRSSDAFLVWMLTYEPLIRALERGEKKDKIEDVIEHFHKEARNRHEVENLHCAGARDVAVEEVYTPFEVTECNGIEKVVRAPDFGRRRNIMI